MPAPKQPLTSSRGTDPTTTQLRYQFLKAVDDVAPELASKMVEDLSPVFTSLSEVEADTLEDSGLHGEWELWAAPYGLHRDTWIRCHALALLRAWVRNPDLPPAGLSSAPLLAAYRVPGRQITPPGPYRPDLETRDQYRKSHEEYADLVDEVAHTLQLRPAPWKPDATIHLRWLARFQVAGETVESIASSDGKDAHHVQKVLKQMAGLIGLTRRTL